MGKGFEEGLSYATNLAFSSSEMAQSDGKR